MSENNPTSEFTLSLRRTISSLQAEVQALQNTIKDLSQQLAFSQEREQRLREENETLRNVQIHLVRDGVTCVRIPRPSMAWGKVLGDVTEIPASRKHMDVVEVHIVPKFVLDFRNFVPKIEETMCRMSKDQVARFYRRERIREVAERVRGFLSGIIAEEVIRQLNDLLGPI